jgi:hypothetical protein
MEDPLLISFTLNFEERQEIQIAPNNERENRRGVEIRALIHDTVQPHRFT